MSTCVIITALQILFLTSTITSSQTIDCASWRLDIYCLGVRHRDPPQLVASTAGEGCFRDRTCDIYLIIDNHNNQRATWTLFINNQIGKDKNYVISAWLSPNMARPEDIKNHEPNYQFFIYATNEPRNLKGCAIYIENQRYECCSPQGTVTQPNGFRSFDGKHSNGWSSYTFESKERLYYVHGAKNYSLVDLVRDTNYGFIRASPFFGGDPSKSGEAVLMAVARGRRIFGVDDSTTVSTTVSTISTSSPPQDVISSSVPPEQPGGKSSESDTKSSPAVPAPGNTGSRSSTLIIVIPIVIILTLIIVAISVMFGFRKRKAKKTKATKESSQTSTDPRFLKHDDTASLTGSGFSNLSNRTHPFIPSMSDTTTAEPKIETLPTTTESDERPDALTDDFALDEDQLQQDKGEKGRNEKL